MLMFIVAKTKKKWYIKNDTLQVNFINLFFCIFKVLQCLALGAALDNCLCFFFFCQKSVLLTDSITIVNVRLWRGVSAV